MAKKLPITPFDLITLPQSMQMFKAIIPYMDYNLQKNLSMLIRMNEFEQTMHFYNSPHSRNAFKSCSSNISFNSGSINDFFSNPEIVNSILIYCPEKYASMINNFRNFSTMSDLFNSFNDNSQKGNDVHSPSSFDFSNIFSGNKNGSDIIFNKFMNPEQQKMYNKYLEELDQIEKKESAASNPVNNKTNPVSGTD